MDVNLIWERPAAISRAGSHLLVAKSSPRRNRSRADLSFLKMIGLPEGNKKFPFGKDFLSFRILGRK